VRMFLFLFLFLFLVSSTMVPSTCSSGPSKNYVV
jgi:hypothetical protein